MTVLAKRANVDLNPIIEYVCKGIPEHDTVHSIQFGIERIDLCERVIQK